MQYTNNYKLPKGIFDSVVNETYDVTKDDPKILSVTSLIDEPKIVTLRKRHFKNLTEDVSDNIWLLLGSSVHEVVSRISGENRIIEQRYQIEIDGYIITGKPDLADKVESLLQDYKVTSVWAYVYNKDGKREWIRQLNVYRYLLANGTAVDKVDGVFVPCAVQESIELENLQNILILRDWSKRESRKNSDYPQIPVQVVDIPRVDDSRVEAFIKQQIQRHHEAQSLPDDEIPICSPESRWHKDDSWAVYKSEADCKNGKRALRVFDNETEANSMARQMSPVGFVQLRQGEDTRCQDYCQVKHLCNHGRVRYPEGEQDGAES